MTKNSKKKGLTGVASCKKLTHKSKIRVVPGTNTKKNRTTPSLSHGCRKRQLRDRLTNLGFFLRRWVSNLSLFESQFGLCGSAVVRVAGAMIRLDRHQREDLPPG